MVMNETEVDAFVPDVLDGDFQCAFTFSTFLSLLRINKVVKPSFAIYLLYFYSNYFI